MVIKCLCFDGVKKTVKIVRFVLESCTFRFRDYIYRIAEVLSLISKVGRSHISNPIILLLNVSL